MPKTISSCRRLFLALALFQLVSVRASEACTLFASYLGQVPVAGKIRDTQDHHEQALKIHEVNGSGEELFSYLGLFAENGAESITLSPLKMGVNERGLFIGFATASSVPREARRTAPYFRDLTHFLLTRASSVKEAIEILSRIKEPLGSRIMILADGSESVLLENGLEGHFQLQRRPEIFATNHFQSPKLRHMNVQAMTDSRRRLELAETLMPYLSTALPVYKDLWVPDDESKSTYTRSDFAVYYPPGQSPQLRVRMENGGKIQTVELSLEQVFPRHSTRL